MFTDVYFRKQFSYTVGRYEYGHFDWQHVFNGYAQQGTTPHVTRRRPNN